MNADVSIVPVQNTVSTIAMPSLPSLAEVETLKEMCKVAAYSGFLNSNSRDITQRSADAFFVVMLGRERGIPPMTALQTIYVLDGKPTCSGQALLSLIRRAGCEVDIPNPSLVTDSATVRTRRPGSTVWKEYTYTLDMAKKAGLATKKNWERHAAEMLIWRAVSTMARFEYPDIAGALYTVEEINPDLDVDADGSPLRMGQMSITPSAQESPTITVEKPAETPPDLPTPEETPKLRWVNEDRFARVKRDVTQLTGDWESIVPTLVREKGITNIDDMMQWDAAFETGKAAWSYIEQAFTALLAATPPAAPKAPTYGKTPVPQSPPKFEWTADRIGAMDAFVRANYWDKEFEGAMSPDKLLVMTGVPGAAWSGFTDMEEAKAMIKTTAIKHGVSIIAHYAQYEGQYSELGNDQFTVRLYGRDKIRAVSPDWQAYVDSWQKGQRYTFADKGNLIVHWQPNKDGFPQATDIQPTDIPF